MMIILNSQTTKKDLDTNKYQTASSLMKKFKHILKVIFIYSLTFL